MNQELSATNKLALLLARAREAKNPTLTPQSILGTSPSSPQEPSLHKQFGGEITLNKEQQAFVQLVLEGKSCILIGAAGTGKTTCTKEAIKALLARGVPILPKDLEHKYLQPETPGIVTTSYTRRAVQNISKATSSVLPNSSHTLHKLLEYSPVPYTVTDEETGEDRESICFEPTRNFLNPLPQELKIIFLDESSMISKELFLELDESLQNPAKQYIFLGDIHQLPPVFGDAILIHKLLELPIIELTEVYRQALDSPIISLATQIKNGVQQTFSKNETFFSPQKDSKVTIHPWKKQLSGDNAVLIFGNFITAAIDSGAYLPEEDIILCPYNEKFGCIEINKNIANHLARKRGALTYEIIAGFLSYYYSAGDKILFDKEDAEVLSIEKNPDYFGKPYQPASKTLTYWGIDTVQRQLEQGDLDVDDFLDSLAGFGEKEEDEERKKAASHIMTIRLANSDKKLKLSSAAAFNKCLLAYALTVHKSQGSEWRRVFLVLHQSHNKMINRELLYTAVTRAREELYIICEPSHLKDGVARQRIKGLTLKDKIEWFKENCIKRGISLSSSLAKDSDEEES